MSSLLSDIHTASDWIIKAFAEDKLELDYTINSFIAIDVFFNQHLISNGVPGKRGRLAKNVGYIVFALGAYIGQTFIKNIPGSVWILNDEDPEGEMTASIKLPNGIIFPMQKVLNRFLNGTEDALYIYGYNLTKDYVDEPFDKSFWQKIKTIENPKNTPWWKFW